MNNPHFYLGTREKENLIYLFYNKALQAYKYGITSKSIQERIEDYCNEDIKKFIFYDHDVLTKKLIVHKYTYGNRDINILFAHKLDNVNLIEKELHKMIRGCRLKLSGQRVPFREHFTGHEKAKEILSYLNKYIT